MPVSPRARRATALAAAVVGGAFSLAATSCGEDSSADATAARPAGTWKRVFVDHFDHGLDESRWGRYEGQPGGDPGGWWEPSHVVVRNGRMELLTYRDPRYGNRWVSGGVSSAHGLKQRYGKYLVRFRMDAGKGVSGILLLFPSGDHWPPEIDFAEDGGDDDRRESMSATLHYGEDNHQIQRTVRADFTRWHTMGVEWTPGKLVYTIDGRRWATVRSRHVPAERMELDVQTQAGTCGERWAPCPDESTPRRVDMQVEWVKAYAWRR